jgi:hypothetical protein
MFDNSGRVVLTHQGIKEVEDARMRPNSSTDHFQPNTINNVLYNFGTMNNPAIQQGTSNSNQTIIVTPEQKVLIIESIRQLKEIIQQRESIPYEKYEEIENEISNAELESKSKKPKWGRVKDSLTFIKNIAEGSAISVSLVPKIVPILGMIGG